MAIAQLRKSDDSVAKQSLSIRHWWIAVFFAVLLGFSRTRIANFYELKFVSDFDRR